MHEIFESFVLGVVEGATEYLPVSSTGHLIIVGDWIHFEGANAKVFDVFIQLGAILSVVVLYFRRFLSLLDFKRGARPVGGLSGIQGILKLFIACLPAFISGGLLHHLIKEKLYTPGVVAAALILGAIVMIAVERHTRKATTLQVENISYVQALIIGMAQCLALWPGMSRSACTIIAGMLCGLERKVAAEFSFLIAVPLMCGAVAYDFLKSFHSLSMADLDVFCVGFIVSFITALLAVRIFIAIVSRYSLEVFAWYRILLGVLVIVMAM